MILLFFNWPIDIIRVASKLEAPTKTNICYHPLGCDVWCVAKSKSLGLASHDAGRRAGLSHTLCCDVDK